MSASGRAAQPVRRRPSPGTVVVALALVASAAAASPPPAAVALSAAEAADHVPEPAELEAAGAVIGDIDIEIHDIFDTELPGESGWLYRTANKIHIATREETIRRQLLFKSGDPYRHQLIDETERLLREHDYLYDATIRPIAVRDGVVDLVVRTRDVWTLNPGFSYSRQGGENNTGAQIEEKNLLGTGQQIGLAWGKDVDRETIRFDYYNPHFRDGFTELGLMYADASDGITKSFALRRPFYALDTRWAAGIELLDGEHEQPRYALGEEIGDFTHREQHYEIGGGVSRGREGRWVRRWTAGLTYQRDEFDLLPDVDPGGPLPEDRELAYPWLGFEIVEDRFQERHNQDQIRRTEDVLLGLRTGVRLGYASETLGSDRDAVIVNAWFHDGLDLGPRASLFANMTVSGRIEDGDVENGVIEGELRCYIDTSNRSKFFATVSGAVAEDLDLENQLLLGGDNGLRGYPLRYQAGTSRALLTIEQRYYSNWYPFRLFHVGAAAFADVGRTWGTDVTGLESSGWLRDVGIGLRLGSSRSSFGNVIHIDLAFPLDGGDDIDDVQLNIETKGRF